MLYMVRPSLNKMLFLIVILAVPISFCLAENWSVHGPYGGTVTTIAVHPRDTSVVYAGTDKAGLYRSTDAGEHWQLINTGVPVLHPYTQNPSADSLAILQDYYPITTIRFAPLTPDTVFAGTEGAGVVRSTNCGATWSPVNTGLPDSAIITAIGIAPQAPVKVWCLTANPTGGIYQSTDAGNTWRRVNTLPHGGTYTWTAITFVPGYPDTMYAGFTSAGEPDTAWGLVRSIDGGTTWQLMSDHLSFYDIQVNPADSTDLWSVVYTGSQAWHMAHSLDGGHSWSLYPTGTPWAWVNNMQWGGGQTLFVQTGAAPPVTLWRSDDFGDTWSQLTPNFPVARLGGYTDVAVTRTLATTTYFATVAGIYRSRDGGFTGQTVNQGILNTEIHDVVVHPTNPQVLYAGGAYGAWKSSDAGGSWERLSSRTINAIGFDGQHPDTVYFGGNGLQRTLNHGETMEMVNGSITGEITALCVLHDSTNQVIIGTISNASRYLYRSDNSGDTWNQLDTFSGFLLQKIVQHPTMTSLLYLGTDAYSNSPLMKSIDRGRSWDTGWNTEVGMVTDIAMIPADSDSLYVATRDRGIRVSDDGGRSFRTLSAGDPVVEYTSVTLDRRETPHLIAGSRAQGIFVSPYPEGVWQRVDGAYYPHITDIIYQHTHSRLLAATAGRGVWVGEEIALSTSRDSLHNTLPEQFSLNPPYPNPFNASTTLKFELPKRQDTHIAVYDIKGQLIQTLVDQPMNPGIHTITWDGLNSQKQSVASGIYVIQVQLAYQVASRKVIYLK